MSPLLAKEIRLLLPTYGSALLLAIVPVWLVPESPYEAHYNNTDAAISLFPFWFGAVMLALSSFGREFALQTFPLILAQPLERTRIWWTKVAVLAGAMTTVFAAWGLSCAICVYIDLGRRSNDWRETLMNGGIAAVVIFAGGLWTTLLLRQVIAAFWFTILIPWGILMLIWMYGGTDSTQLVALGLYAVAGFWWARRQFLSVQEAAWTGGVISFPGWRATGAEARSSIRARRSLAALFWKELQLHQVGLAGMAGLFVLHLAVVALRRLGSVALGNTLHSALEVFGGIWLIVPLLAAGPSVAEERKLGTMDAHLCLPVSRRLQCAIKLLYVLVVGGLLSAVLLWTTEGIGSAVGAGSGMAELKIPFDHRALALLALVFLALSLIGFYASTMARNVLQALATAVAAAIGVWFVMGIASHPPEVFRIWFWQGNLVYYVACPTLVATFVWLAWRNFRCVSESWRLWRRNVLGLTGALVFIATSTSAVYHRAWELITPLEPAHGPARLTGAKPTKLYTYGGSTLLALLPDGRLWRDRISYDPGHLYWVFGEATGFRANGKWISLSGNQIVPGSNWVDVVANYNEAVGIRSDGTLWVSEKPRLTWDLSKGKPPPEELPRLVKFGSETNWQSVVQEYRSVILLKQDGTLWRWGSYSFSEKKEWPGLRTFEPQRLGTETDWVRILRGTTFVYAWKRNGHAWRPVIERLPRFDNTIWKSVARYFNYEVGVREDGTLWIWNPDPSALMLRSIPPGVTKLNKALSTGIVQIGKDTDWTTVAGEFTGLAALKADGSLWQWEFSINSWFMLDEDLDLLTKPPVRLGAHTDWVAVGAAMRGIVSLAADGSLWHWRDQDRSDQPMLTPSRKPVKIENILARQE